MAVGQTDKSAPSTFAQYTLLLAHPDENEASSILLPKCYTIKKMETNYEKTGATKVNLQFVAFNRNRYIPLMYIDTLDNLATILGVRSPL